jgi:hypothetical protein
MKYLLFIFFLLLSNTIYSIEGKWVFNNMFSQTVGNGWATLENFNIGVLKSIEFTNIKHNPNDNSNYPLMKGKIEILTSDDTYRIYNCIYLDLGTSIPITIEGEREIEISIFISNVSNRRIWYSYAISTDIQHGIIKGTERNDSMFMNFLGIMEKIN